MSIKVSVARMSRGAKMKHPSRTIVMDVPQESPARIRFGVFEAELHTGELRKNGVKVRIQQLPFRVVDVSLCISLTNIACKFINYPWPPFAPMLDQ